MIVRTVRTKEDLRRELERLLADLEGAGGDPVARARARASILAQFGDLIEGRDDGNGSTTPAKQPHDLSKLSDIELGLLTRLASKIRGDDWAMDPPSPRDYESARDREEREILAQIATAPARITAVGDRFAYKEVTTPITPPVNDGEVDDSGCWENGDE